MSNADECVAAWGDDTDGGIVAKTVCCLLCSSWMIGIALAIGSSLADFL
jgi:hypothetical protein